MLGVRLCLWRWWYNLWSFIGLWYIIVTTYFILLSWLLFGYFILRLLGILSISRLFFLDRCWLVDHLIWFLISSLLCFFCCGRLFTFWCWFSFCICIICLRWLTTRSWRRLFLNWFSKWGLLGCCLFCGGLWCCTIWVSCN